METWATPWTVEMRWARRVSAYSWTSERRREAEEMARKRMGASAGLTFL